MTAERLGTAVVTGAANGIGHASALRLARDGFDVAMIDRDAQGLAQAAAAVRALGRQGEIWAIDCTDESAIKRAFTDIDRVFGQIGRAHV